MAVFVVYALCSGVVCVVLWDLEVWGIFSIFATIKFKPHYLYICYMGRFIIGIDPGSLGGIAVLSDDGGIVSVCRMPDTPQDILDMLRRYGGTELFGSDVVCYMEKVGTGIPGQSSKATATFARHCGHLEMALLALGIKTNEVTPQKWMKSYQLGKSSDYSKTEWKNRLKAKAQQLFPREKVTLAVADALLLAEYGRKQEIGK